MKVNVRKRLCYRGVAVGLQQVRTVAAVLQSAAELWDDQISGTTKKKS